MSIAATTEEDLAETILLDKEPILIINNGGGIIGLTM